MNKFKVGDKVRTTYKQCTNYVGIVRHVGKLKSGESGFMDNAVWSTWGRPWKGKESKLTYLTESELVLVKSCCNSCNKGWKPKHGEKYWYVTDHMTGIGSRTYCGSWWFDVACVKSCNCFRTREQARIKFRKIKKVLREG